MRLIGRAAQLVGLSIPPLAMACQLGGAISLGQMLAMLAFAVCCFLIGWILQGTAGA